LLSTAISFLSHRCAPMALQECAGIAAATPAMQGPVGSVCAEELGADLHLLLGDHASTISRLSPALLQRPSGNSDFRAFLRHLRSLLGDRPRRLADCRARTEAATRTVARDSEAKVEAERHASLDEETRQAAQRQVETEVAALRHDLGETLQVASADRAAWAAERAELIMEIEREAAMAADAAQVNAAEVSSLRGAWHRDTAGGQTHLAAQGRAIHDRSTEYARRNAELAWVWELIAEQRTAICGLKLMLQCSEDNNLKARQEHTRLFQEMISQRLPELEKLSEESLRLDTATY